MKIYDAAFYVAVLFIVGIGIANSSLSAPTVWLVIVAGVIGVGGYIYRAQHSMSVTFIALALLAGATYDHAWTAQKTVAPIIFEKLIELRGIVREVNVDDQKQILRIGQVQLQTDVYPSYAYGDELRVRGKIQAPFDAQKNSLLKNGIRGTIYRPKIERIGVGRGNKIKAELFDIKHAVENKIKTIFAPEEASLLIGLLVGGRGMFDDEFKKKMAASGTTHLVALSGYNIATIAWLIAATLFYVRVRSRSLRFAISLTCIAAFVAMTGAESSVVRAALMGAILLLADHMERVYSVRNTIAIVAAAMLVQNPKLLVFDVGFQLSFLALLGIVYLRPVVSAWLHLEGKSIALDWKKNLSSTIAAQLAVLPILVSAFGPVSWIGIVANVAIVWFVPYIMSLGFAFVLASIISETFAWLIVIPTSFLLRYVIGVIEWSSGIGFTMSMHNITTPEIVTYYVVLALIIYRFKKHHEHTGQ